MDQAGPPGLLSSLQGQLLMDDTQDKISPKAVTCSVTLQGTDLLSDSAAVTVTPVSTGAEPHCIMHIASAPKIRWHFIKNPDAYHCVYHGMQPVFFPAAVQLYLLYNFLLN